jgi:Holliday junction resolvase RusA-like endonuclease
VPDNAKYAAGIKAGGAFILLSTEYRNGKNKAVEQVEEQMRALKAERFPIAVKLRIEARMFEPNRSKRRDISNYTKLVHDALTGIVYADDSQLDRVLWVRAGVDIDRPRLELEVSVLP